MQTLHACKHNSNDQYLAATAGQGDGGAPEGFGWKPQDCRHPGGPSLLPAGLEAFQGATGDWYFKPSSAELSFL